MITAKILADSVNPAGVRLTSWLLTYPRFIHAEFMTHRCFSRNAASSRAIPLEKMLAAVEDAPALPEYWGAEQKGMQSGEQIGDRDEAEAWWIGARDECVDAARFLGQAGLHKSLCNRLIEPWSHITVLATATDHHNFFALRAHPAAMPEFQVLAYRMLALYLQSTPESLPNGSWHIPRFRHRGEDLAERAQRPLSVEGLLKIATARCARLSYLTFDGQHSIDQDFDLHDRLAAAGHWSPFEHCAQADAAGGRQGLVTSGSNFDTPRPSGWVQYRKFFRGREYQSHVDLAALLAAKPAWIATETQVPA